MSDGADFIGRGTAYIATNGKTVKGTWRKASLTGPTRLFGADGGSRVALAQEHCSLCGGCRRTQQRRAEVPSHRRQLFRGDTCRCDIVCGKHDLDIGGEQIGPHHAVGRLVRRATDRRLRGVDLPLGQPQPRKARLRHSSPPAGLPVGLLGLGGLAAQPVGQGP